VNLKKIGEICLLPDVLESVHFFWKKKGRENKKSLLSIKNRDLDSGIYISGFKLII
jgi:hypothetical protein|tara:strand:- start:1236 stop:1403 length:168 start_codon:yes stop_codon:yes gene_type:complete